MDDPAIDLLAQAIHQLYLHRQGERGRTLGETPMMAPWSALRPPAREANQAQARDIERKLHSIDCAIGSGVDPGFAFAPEELERLARQEHERWCRQRRDAGWTYAAVRDDGQRHHPGLVPWTELPEAERIKDRDVVANIPAVLASADLHVVRLSRAARASVGTHDAAPSA